MTAIVAVSVSGTYFGVQQFGDESPMATSSARMVGHVEAIVYGPDGEIKAYRQGDNAIVVNGMDMLADGLFNSTNSVLASSGLIGDVDAIGIGRDATAVTDSDTTLNYANPPTAGSGTCNNVTNIIWDTNGDASSIFISGSQNNASVTVTGQATFGPSAACADTFNEAGALDNSTSEKLFARNTFSSVTLTAADSLQINWDFQFDDQ